MLAAPATVPPIVLFVAPSISTPSRLPRLSAGGVGTDEVPLDEVVAAAGDQDSTAALLTMTLAAPARAADRVARSTLC